MQTLFVFALLCCFAFVTPAGVIDAYTIDAVTQADAGNPLTTMTTVDATAFIGGERTITAVYESGSLDITCSILTEEFSLSSDVSTRGAASALYTAPGGNPFDPPEDFTTDGCDCWNSRLLVSDNRLQIEFEVFDAAAATSEVSTFLIPIDVENPGIDICIPYQGNIATYQTATALDIRLVGTIDNLDASISYICCQPRVDCWHELDLADKTAGDIVDVKLTCFNYDSLPIRPENIDVTFGFDDTIALVQAVACGALANNPRVEGNALRYDATLPPGAMVMCTFELELIDGGVLTDIGATILILPDIGGTPARSNTGGPRFGTEDFCNPPTSADLVIQLPPSTLPPTTLPPTTAPPTTLPPTTLPPTTLPPTTEPPTTLPPTTLPPTTLPPTTLPPTTLPPTTLPPTTAPPTTLPPTTLPPTTLPPTTLPPTTLPPTTLPPTTAPPTSPPPRPPTSVCVTPNIIDGQCICTVFPCFNLDNGDIECEAQEWYCIYYRVLPPNGIIEFNFRGVDCTCMI